MDFACEGLRPSPSPVPVDRMVPGLDLPGPSRRIVVEPLETPERPVELPEREPAEPAQPETTPQEEPRRLPEEVPA